MSFFVGTFDCTTNLLAHNYEENAEVNKDVDGDKVNEGESKLMGHVRVGYIVGENKHQLDGHQQKHLVENLNEIVDFVDHRENCNQENNQDH